MTSPTISLTKRISQIFYKYVPDGDHDSKPPLQPLKKPVHRPFPAAPPHAHPHTRVEQRLLFAMNGNINGTTNGDANGTANGSTTGHSDLELNGAGDQDLSVLGTNRHAVLTGLEELVIEEREIKTPGKGEVLIKVMSTGICGTDTSYFSKGRIGTSVIEGPHVLGHESSGVVHQVGEGVTNVQPGDHVAIEPALPCKECQFCRVGQQNYCKNERYMAAPGTDGTLCQWFVSPAANAVKIPSDISWEEAGAIQPLAIGIQVARRAELRAHQNVVVFGCGPLGLLCMAVARSYGARAIVAVDINEARVDFATGYAATHGFVSPRRPDGADEMEFAQQTADEWLAKIGAEDGVNLVIETTGAQPCIQLAVSLLSNGGKLLQAGLGRRSITFPILDVATKEISVLGAFHYTHRCFEDAIDLIERGLVTIKPIVSKTFGLTRAEDAFRAVQSGQEIKVVIMNQE